MKELRDQSAHFAAAFLVVATCKVLGASIGPLAGLLIGFALGFVREITEEGEVTLTSARAALRSKLDLIFWTLGGTAGGMI